MEQMIAATNQLSIKANKLLHIVEAINIDSKTAEALGELVKSVESNVTTLTVEARKLAKAVDDSELQKKLYSTVEVWILGETLLTLMSCSCVNSGKARCSTCELLTCVEE